MSLLGNNDDYVSFDVGRNAYISYNGDNDDEGTEGFGINPPIYDCVLLEGPAADSFDGRDNNRNDTIDEPNEEAAVNHFYIQ